MTLLLFLSWALSPATVPCWGERCLLLAEHPRCRRGTYWVAPVRQCQPSGGHLVPLGTVPLWRDCDPVSERWEAGRCVEARR